MKQTPKEVLADALLTEIRKFEANTGAEVLSFQVQRLDISEPADLFAKTTPLRLTFVLK